jgi:hypothetical protein
MRAKTAEMQPRADVARVVLLITDFTDRAGPPTTRLGGCRSAVAGLRPPRPARARLRVRLRLGPCLVVAVSCRRGASVLGQRLSPVPQNHAPASSDARACTIRDLRDPRRCVLNAAAYYEKLFRLRLRILQQKRHHMEVFKLRLEGRKYFDTLGKRINMATGTAPPALGV